MVNESALGFVTGGNRRCAAKDQSCPVSRLAPSPAVLQVSVGGTTTRHDVSVEQLGERTHTNMRSFLLCGDSQLHDLHSKLKLDHPHGEADQLHK